MYQIQSDKLNYFEKEINNPNRQITYRFTLNDELLETNQIFDNPIITCDTGLTQFGLGSVLIRTLQLSLHSEVFVMPMSVINIEIGLNIYNESTRRREVIYVPMGVFHVDEVETKGSKKTIKAYDGMYKLNKGYFPSAKHTTTQAIAEDIASANELSVSGLSSVDINNEQLEGKTYIEMLSLIASVMGCNVRMSRDGSTIEFLEATIQDLVFDESDYMTPTIGEYEFNITKLRINCSDKVTNDEGEVTDEGYYEVGEGTDSQTLELSNPLLKDKASQAEAILSKIQKLNGYKSYETAMPSGDFRLDPFDIVTFNKGEDEYIVPVLFSEYSLSYAGVGIEIQASVDAPSKKEFGFKGTLTQKVENIYTQIIQAQEIIANKVTVDELNATIAKIEELYVKYGEFEELIADSAIIGKLEADLIEVNKIIADFGQFGDLEAITATIELLKAKVAEIDSLIADSILSEIIQSGSISSDLLNIKDAFIKDAMIHSLTASKVTSGVINTNNVSIQSDDGNMLIQGNLLQFKDANDVVRIQIGKDTKGNYTFVLYDSTGKGVLINQDGIQTSDAIKDGLIVDANINDNANISGGKLDISSVFEEMNADGSSTLNASKVYLNDKEQTLEVSFKQMTTKQDDLEESVNTAITDLTVAQGQIKTLIQDTSIISDGASTKLKDAFSKLQQNVNGISATVGKVESTVNANTGEIGDIKSDMASIKLDLDKIELGITSVKDKIDDIQLGGKNLLSKFNMQDGNLSGSNGGELNGSYFANYYRTKNFIEVDTSSTYVIKINKNTAETFIEKVAFYTSNDTFISAEEMKASEKVFTLPTNCKKIKLVVHIPNTTASKVVEEYELKLEKGNKASDYTPNPNDIYEELENLEEAIGGAIKDGIISEAEAKAIQEHLKRLDTEKVDVDAQYNELYTNEYLK